MFWSQECRGRSSPARVQPAVTGSVLLGNSLSPLVSSHLVTTPWTAADRHVSMSLEAV